jgi:pilus assembly protein Flp/PilA
MDEPRCSSTERAAAGARVSPERSGRTRDGVLRFTGDARGSTATEYALIGGLIFLVAVGSMRYYSSRVSAVYGTISAAVTQSN